MQQAAWQPGAIKINHVCGDMDPFQVSRPAHSHLSSPFMPIGSLKNTMNTNGHIICHRSTPSFGRKLGRSGSLAHSKSNVFMLPWTPSKKSLETRSLTSVLTFHTHRQWTNTINTNGHLISRKSSCRNLGDISSSQAHSKSNVFMLPWTPSKSLNPLTQFCHNNQTTLGVGCPPTRHQVVSGVAPSKSCRFGLRFWQNLVSHKIAKHPGLTAILVPDSNTMEDRTPSWHTKQRQAGAGRPPARHQVVS